MQAFVAVRIFMSTGRRFDWRNPRRRMTLKSARQFWNPVSAIADMEQDTEGVVRLKPKAL